MHLLENELKLIDSSTIVDLLNQNIYYPFITSNDVFNIDENKINRYINLKQSQFQSIKTFRHFLLNVIFSNSIYHYSDKECMK